MKYRLLSLFVFIVLQLQANADTDLMNIDMAIYRRTHKEAPRERFDIIENRDDIVLPNLDSYPLVTIWLKYLGRAGSELQLRWEYSEEVVLIAPLTLEPYDQVDLLAAEEVTDKILIKLNKGSLFVWDVTKNCIHSILETDLYYDEEVHKTRYNKTETELFIFTNKRFLIWSFVTDEIREESFFPKNDEICMAVKFNDNKNEALIITSKRLLIYDLTTFQVKEAPSLPFSYYNRWSALYIAENEVLIAQDRQILIWDTVAQSIKNVPFTLQDDTTIDSFQRFSNGHKLLMSSTGQVLIWDIVNDIINVCPFAVQEGEDDEIRRAYLNKNEDMAVIETFRRVLLWDLSKNEIAKYQFHLNDDSDEIIATDFINEGTRIVIGTEDHVFIWDAKTNNLEEFPLTEESDHAGRVNSVRYDPDKHKILIELDICMFAWDPETKKIERIFFVDECPSYYTKDGTKLIVDIVTPSRTCLTLVQDSLLWLLKELTDEQIEFLKKAAGGWQVERAYELKESEMALYKSLPRELKKQDLFTIIAG